MVEDTHTSRPPSPAETLRRASALIRDEFAAERRATIIEALSWWEDDDGRWGREKATEVLMAHEAEWCGGEA